MRLNWQFSFKDNPLGREMMARQIARQFCRLREVHSLVYGRRTSGKNGGRNGGENACKLIASTWGRLGEPPNGLFGLKVCHSHTF